MLGRLVESPACRARSRRGGRRRHGRRHEDILGHHNDGRRKTAATATAAATAAAAAAVAAAAAAAAADAVQIPSMVARDTQGTQPQRRDKRALMETKRYPQTPRHRQAGATPSSTTQPQQSRTVQPGPTPVCVTSSPARGSEGKATPAPARPRAPLPGRVDEARCPPRWRPTAKKSRSGPRPAAAFRVPAHVRPPMPSATPVDLAASQRCTGVTAPPPRRHVHVRQVRQTALSGGSPPPPPGPPVARCPCPSPPHLSPSRHRAKAGNDRAGPTAESLPKQPSVGCHPSNAKPTTREWHWMAGGAGRSGADPRTSPLPPGAA